MEPDKTVVVIDGYEQLSRWSRFRLKRCCRRRQLGLVVTTHAPAGMPELFRTATSAALAQSLVDVLMGDHARTFIGPDELARKLDACRGDLRELLFALYDRYELWVGKGQS